MTNPAMPLPSAAPPVLSLILLAGGESKRMGQHKALLPIPGSGEPLIRHLLRRLMPLVSGRLIVVTNTPAIGQAVTSQFTATCLADAWPGVGPLGGVATGLGAAPGWAIVLACDLPFVNPTLFQYLWSLAQAQLPDGSWRWQAVVPRVEGEAQPLHALYHPTVIPVIDELLGNGERRMSGLPALVRTRWVEQAEIRRLDAELRSFMNVNTPAEWAAACAVLRGE